jgi:putative PIN family toxin of toxin-antitoxin system
MLRVILDTNVIGSGLLRKEGPPAAIRVAWRQGRFKVYLSPVLFTELLDVISRPRFAKSSRLSPSEITEFVERLSVDAIFVEPESVEAIARDSDDHVIATALSAQVEFIVTGDQDLLVLGPSFRAIQIVSPTDFLSSL